MFLLNRDCHRRFLCVDCHPGYKRVLRLIYIYFCDILSSFYYYSNIKILKIKTPQRARARTCAHAHPKISKHAHAHARAREKILKVRTRTHAHSLFSKDAHAHARAREKILRCTRARTRTRKFRVFWNYAHEHLLFAQFWVSSKSAIFKISNFQASKKVQKLACAEVSRKTECVVSRLWLPGRGDEINRAKEKKVFN